MPTASARCAPRKPSDMEPRTYLFVPGNRPERFAKALASGADAVLLDLEDAVAAALKSEARDAIAQWSRQAAEADSARVVVRINNAQSTDFTDDLRLLRDAHIAGVMLPKAESAAQVQAVRDAVPDARVLALIESARGVAAAHDVAAASGVTRLVFGTLDYALDLDLDIAESPDGLSHAASVLAIASRVAGLMAPVAGVTPQIDDEQRLLADLAWARRHGFGAKLCIHPRQVAPIHAALAPSAREIEWARRVLAAEAASPGAAQLDGRMIDRPVVLQAQRTLQRAGA
jgi:citrate lyase subunit beta/citryl-CoA lyase